MIHCIIIAITALLLATPAASLPKTRNYGNRNEAAAAAGELDALMKNDRQLRTLWEAWKAENSKPYVAGTPQDAAKFATWRASLGAVVAHNSNPNAAFFKGLNKFSDLSFNEFKASYLMPDRPATELAARTADIPAFTPPAPARKLLQTTVPTEFDWRAKGKVPPPRDQGGCGSCWAFAGIGAIEIKAAIDRVNATPNLSEEQMVDCVNSAAGYWSQGCNGGYSDEVFRYISKSWATTEAAYPYVGTTSTCLFNAGATPPAGALKLSPQPGVASVTATPAAIMQAVSSTGPVVSYFNVVDSFYGYTSGVYQASQCTADTYNHAMVIVGYNSTAGVGSPDSYWIIRNSWGTWGDAGYIKVQMTGDSLGACRMYSGLMVALTTSNATTATPTPSPPPAKKCSGRKC